MSNTYSKSRAIIKISHFLQTMTNKLKFKQTNKLEQEMNKWDNMGL